MQPGAVVVRRHRQRPVAALAALLLVLSTSLGEPAATLAAKPNAAAAADYLAGIQGGRPGDFQLVYERRATVDGAPLWAGKLVDRDGNLRIVYRDAMGAIGGPELLDRQRSLAAQAQSGFARKADAALQRAAAAATSPAAQLSVAIWLDADPAAAVQAVVQRHPEFRWIGDRPVVDDLAAMRRIRGELWQARRDAYASVQSRADARVRALGGTVAYASTSAPMLFADLPVGALAAVAEDRAVRSLGLEQRWQPSMSSAGPAMDANWTSGSGDQGTGVRYAVVEYHNVRERGDLAGKVVASHSTSGTLAHTTSGQFDHPTWVAGAVAGQSPTYRGVAPGALIVSSGTGGYAPSLTYDRKVIAAADWAISPNGGDADIINTSLVQDTATGAEEARRFFDAIVDEDGRLAVSAAGNYVNFSSWTVGSPGRGWNVLTVGGTDDRNTAGRADDRIWYVPGSNGSAYVDPAGTDWNRHGDFNKPNVSAPAVTVRTANGLNASGTSVATPIVGGIAAQLIARRPSLGTWPEAVRALIMAGAFRHAHMRDGSVNADHEGVGMPSARWSNRLLVQGDGRYGGYRIGLADGSRTVQQHISVQAGQRVRVVVTWNSHTSGSDNLDKADELATDFDLRVVPPGSAAVGGWSFDNNYEVVDFTATASGTATITLPSDRMAAGGERYALAWSKVSYGTPQRLGGSGRYATAAAVSRDVFAPGVPVAYVAGGSALADALAAGPAAAAGNGPVLLTRASSLPSRTRAELQRLRPGRIYVVGSRDAVSDAVFNALRGYTSGRVERLAASTRYTTAVALSAGTFDRGVPAAFIAHPDSLATALSAASGGAVRGGPLLYVRHGRLPGAVARELDRLRPGRIYVVGASVDDAVLATLARHTDGPVTRLAGGSRYATAATVARRFVRAPQRVFVSNGSDIAHGVAAVAAAGRLRSPLVLARHSSLPASTRDALRRLWPARTVVLGPSDSLDGSIVTAVRHLLDDP